MKAEYDTVVPRNYCNSKYVHDLYDFLDSKHQSAKLEYDSKPDAVKAYRSFHAAKSRYRIYGVKITKRDNIVYISRVDSDLSGITNYDRIRNMSVEELAGFLTCVAVNITLPCAKCNEDKTKNKDGCESCLTNWLKSEEWDADRTN